MLTHYHGVRMPPSAPVICFVFACLSCGSIISHLLALQSCKLSVLHISLLLLPTVHGRSVHHLAILQYSPAAQFFFMSHVLIQIRLAT